MMVKLRSGDSGSLSVSLIERISALSEKVYNMVGVTEVIIG